MSAASKRHMKRIHELPCVVCKHCHGRTRPCAEAHHLEAYRGDHSPWATIPLCKPCHDLLHAMHRKPFYLLHRLDDVKLMAWTVELLEKAA